MALTRHILLYTLGTQFKFCTADLIKGGLISLSLSISLSLAHFISYPSLSPPSLPPSLSVLSPSLPPLPPSLLWPKDGWGGWSMWTAPSVREKPLPSPRVVAGQTAEVRARVWVCVCRRGGGVLGARALSSRQCFQVSTGRSWTRMNGEAEMMMWMADDWGKVCVCVWMCDCALIGPKNGVLPLQVYLSAEFHWECTCFAAFSLECLLWFQCVLLRGSVKLKKWKVALNWRNLDNGRNTRFLHPLTRGLP